MAKTIDLDVTTAAVIRIESESKQAIAGLTGPPSHHETIIRWAEDHVELAALYLDALRNSPDPRDFPLGPPALLIVLLPGRPCPAITTTGVLTVQDIFRLANWIADHDDLLELIERAFDLAQATGSIDGNACGVIGAARGDETVLKTLADALDPPA